MALSMNSVGIPGGFRGSAGFSGKFGVWGGFGRFGGSKGFCANSQPKRVVSKRVVSADVPPERKPERGYVHQNHPFTKPPFYLPVTLLGVDKRVVSKRVVSADVPLERKPERGYVRQNHPFTKPPFYLPVNWAMIWRGAKRMRVGKRTREHSLPKNFGSPPKELLACSNVDFCTGKTEQCPLRGVENVPNEGGVQDPFFWEGCPWSFPPFPKQPSRTVFITESNSVVFYYSVVNLLRIVIRYSKYSKSLQNVVIHYIFSSESLRVVNSLQIVNTLRVLFLVCRGRLGFHPCMAFSKNTLSCTFSFALWNFPWALSWESSWGCCRIAVVHFTQKASTFMGVSLASSCTLSCAFSWALSWESLVAPCGWEFSRTC